MLLEGVHVPLLTPFYPDGRVYVRKLEHNVRRLSLTPVAGLIALGPASEDAALSTDEKREILSTVASTAAPDKVLLAGIAEAGVSPALALAEHAATLLFDVILLRAPAAHGIPFWNSGEPTPELLTWFRTIADRSPLPILLAGTAAGHTLPIATIAALAEHPNILGTLEESTHLSRIPSLKAATAHIQRTATTTITFTAATTRMVRTPEQPTAAGTFVNIADLATGTAVGGAALAVASAPPALKTRTKAVGHQLLWSRAADATEALHAGATGLLLETAASIPQAVFEIWAGYKDGDHALMREKQHRVAHAEPYLLQHGTAALKAAAELSGYFGGRPRLPQLPITAAEQAEIIRLLDGMRS